VRPLSRWRGRVRPTRGRERRLLVRPVLPRIQHARATTGTRPCHGNHRSADERRGTGPGGAHRCLDPDRTPTRNRDRPGIGGTGRRSRNRSRNRSHSRWPRVPQPTGVPCAVLAADLRPKASDGQFEMFAPLVLTVKVYTTGNRLEICKYWRLRKIGNSSLFMKSNPGCHN
jgi:hypothetical protein